jgi:hypothetical protein
MRVSAETFSITPRVGVAGQSLAGNAVESVHGALQTTLTLIEDGDKRVCILSTHAITDLYRYSDFLRPAIAETLKMDPAHVLCFTSHNHCACIPFDPSLPQAKYGKLADDVRPLRLQDLTDEGRLILEMSRQVAARLPAKLRNAEVRWARGHERRISYNRKGHRADGSTYMLREADRLLLGADFNGDIDDDAFVVGFFSEDNQPISFLTSFTAHPATAYHPEKLVIFGEYPQVACDELSRANGNVPVGFLQGCAGDVNAKGTVSQNPSVADATRLGQFLGETFKQAARKMTASAQQDMKVSLCDVHLPFAAPPGLDGLNAMIADMENFTSRCAKDDPDTLACQGLNFPAYMSPRYRAVLVDPLLAWARWVREFHLHDRLHELPKGVDFEIAAIRLGDVGIVGLPCEPFDAIGRQIKRHSPCAVTLPCGYMNDDCVFYIPDSGNNGDNDYQSAFYRYTTNMLAYAQPAGDRLAEMSVELLRAMMLRTP